MVCCELDWAGSGGVAGGRRLEGPSSAPLLTPYALLHPAPGAARGHGKGPWRRKLELQPACWCGRKGFQSPVSLKLAAGGYDSEVKVWDANALDVAASFSLGGRVHAVAMSPIASTHCLVAVGSAEPQARRGVLQLPLVGAGWFQWLLSLLCSCSGHRRQRHPALSRLDSRTPLVRLASQA